MSMPPCPPGPADKLMGSPFAALFASDPCSAIPVLHAAYTELLLGAQRSKVAFKDRTIDFHKPDAAALWKYITWLSAQCPDARTNPTPGARAFRAQGRFPAGPGFPPGFLPSRYR